VFNLDNQCDIENYSNHQEKLFEHDNHEETHFRPTERENVNFEEREEFENRIPSQRCVFEFNRLEEARFWSRIMQEHALFIKLGLPADQPKLREEAQEFINSVKTKYWDASHNVYAYYIEGINILQKYSDAGEPAGTAGLPVFEAIRKMELKNVAIVVTRYFGGILLGAGGLVRAYGKACAGSLDEGVEIFVKPCLELKITIEYHLSGKLQNMLINEGFILADTGYTNEVTFTVYSPKEKKEYLEDRIREITGGILRLEVVGNKNVRLDKSGKILES
jgi:uncharacterized YigZ family protein